MKLQLSLQGDRTIVMTRDFAAPRALLFEALTKPEYLRRWFTGTWTLETCEVDLRVGGSYRYVWLAPEGFRMGMSGVLTEVVAPERIVQTEQFDQSWYPGEAIGTLELVELDARTTRLTMTVEYSLPEGREAVLRTPMEQGISSNYDRLAALLTEGESV